MFVTVKEDALGQLEICGGTYSEVWQGKPRVAMTSDQTSLDVVPRLGSWVSSLHLLFKSLATNCTTFWSLKLCVLLSFYIKMMKRRTLQVCSLKHSIKKGMFFCLWQIEIITSAGGVLSPGCVPVYILFSFNVVNLFCPTVYCWRSYFLLFSLN